MSQTNKPPAGQPEREPEPGNGLDGRIVEQALAAAKAGGIVVLFGQFRGGERRVVVRREPGAPLPP